MVTTLSSIVVFAFVGPRPVYSRSTWTAEVAIFAEGLWLSCFWSMGHLSAASSGGRRALRVGEEALEPRRQRSLERTPRKPVASAVVLSANCGVRGGAGPSICDTPVFDRTGPRAARQGQLSRDPGKEARP